MQSEQEIQQYLESLKQTDRLPSAFERFAAHTAGGVLINQAARQLTDALSIYNLAVTPAKLLVAGYANVNPSAKSADHALDVMVQLGKFLILSTTGPVGAALGSASLGLSVLAMFDAAEEAKDQARQRELIRSLATKLDSIRAAAQAREAAGHAREVATDADETDEENVLAWCRGMPFTVADHARTVTFFEHTLPAIRPLDGERLRLRQAVGGLTKYDLALIHSMGDLLIGLGPAEAGGHAKESVFAFEDEVLDVVRDIEDERKRPVPTEAVPSAVHGTLVRHESGLPVPEEPGASALPDTLVRRAQQPGKRT